MLWKYFRKFLVFILHGSKEYFLQKSVKQYSPPQREVVGAVAKGNTNKYTIDAKDIQFQVSLKSHYCQNIYHLTLYRSQMLFYICMKLN